MENLLEYIEHDAVLCDGAMGTQLYERGIFLNRCFDEINLSEPDLVKKIHEDYIASGAMIIETNTFGANRFKLQKHQLGNEVVRINAAGVGIAREAARNARVWIAGSMGPLGVKIEPWGKIGKDEAREAFREQAEVLISEGVDLIILETFGDLSEMGEAIRAVKDVSNLPVIAQMTINSDGTSLYGTGPEIFTARLEEWGADIIGLNCSVGPHDMLDTLKKMSRYTSLPLSIQPNAGKARTIEGRVFYLASPDYFAKYTHRFIQEGARVVGGCCGTTPEHIRAMSSVVRMYRKNPRKIAVSTNVKETEESAGTFGETLPVKEKSLLGAKLAAGEKIYSLELTPPRGWELEKILSRAKKAKEGGFDAVNLPDGPRASARVGVTAVAVKIAEKIGIEPIIHYACRDRSLLGMQSDLLGAFALGLRNLLIITGDPPVLGDYPKSTPVFDVDSIGLTNLARFLNRGLDVGHHPIGKPTGFLIGVGINPAAVNPELELERFYWKVDAGAEFAVSQPVFDTDQLFAFLDRAEEVLRSKGLGMIPVLGGVWPLASLKNAEFLRNEVPGVSVPDSVIQRMAAAAEVSDERAEGVAMAKEMMEVMFPRVAGFQISSPFGRIAPALELIGFAKELEQAGKIKI